MIMQQAKDFRLECECLADLLEGRHDDVYAKVTQFKGWSIDDVIGHLHMFNHAARLTLEDSNAFADFFAPVGAALAQGRSMLDAQYVWLDGLTGRALFEAWKEECSRTAGAYENCDPKQRVKWAGPDMSARSSITARQMETWAHGQEVFDCLAAERIDTDRIRNIAHLGVNTFGWTFINRKLPVPVPAPHVVLTAPSGTVWEFNDPQTDNRVAGTATEFCQVVTQTRNVADTNISAIGETANNWMAMAQCFAGDPMDPPPVGSRHKAG